MCLLSPPTPLPTTRVLTDSAQQATLASGQVQDFSRGPSFNTKEQLMEGFKIRHLFIGDRKLETQRSGELGLSPLRILMLRTRYGKCVDGLRTEVALPVAGLNIGSLGVEETGALGNSHCEARRGGYRDINTE